MKRLVKAGLVAAAVLASATAALAMPTVPANVLASGDSDAVIQVKGGHGHGQARTGIDGHRAIGLQGSGIALGVRAGRALRGSRRVLLLTSGRGCR